METCALAALGHDLCKVGTYQQTMKNEKVKNADGTFATDYKGKAVWQEVPGYEFVPSTCPLGHGDSSVFRLIQNCGRKVPMPVILAIRWHMGAYYAKEGEEMNRMADAMKISPLVILIQTADLLDTYQGWEKERIVEYVANLTTPGETK